MFCRVGAACLHPYFMSAHATAWCSTGTCRAHIRVTHCLSFTLRALLHGSCRSVTKSIRDLAAHAARTGHKRVKERGAVRQPRWRNRSARAIHHQDGGREQNHLPVGSQCSSFLWFKEENRYSGSRVDKLRRHTIVPIRQPGASSFRFVVRISRIFMTNQPDNDRCLSLSAACPASSSHDLAAALSTIPGCCSRRTLCLGSEESRSQLFYVHWSPVEVLAVLAVLKQQCIHGDVHCDAPRNGMTASHLCVMKNGVGRAGPLPV